MSKNTGYVVGILLVGIIALVGVLVYVFLPNNDTKKDNGIGDTTIIYEEPVLSGLTLKSNNSMAKIDMSFSGYEGTNALWMFMSEEDYNALYASSKNYVVALSIEFREGNSYMLQTKLNENAMDASRRICVYYVLPEDFALPTDIENRFFTAHVLLFEDSELIFESNLAGEGEEYLILQRSSQDNECYMTCLELKLNYDKGE